MKRFLSLLALTVLVVASCSKYDDTELRNKVNGYESRIAALEALSSYKDLLGKLSAGKTVTGFSQSGNEITLTFSDNTTVKFNQQGPKGDPGESIKGDPGDPGDPGSPGQDGVTPQFKIEGENWMVSYDEGKTWKNAGRAIDRSLIKDIKVEGDVLKITLADGTVVPVTYGEKEGYGLSIARHYVTGYESQRSFILREFRVPYTLSGDIDSPDDVKFTFNVTDNCYDFIPDSRKTATAEKTTAKSGYFVLHQKGYYAPRVDRNYVSYEDGEFYFDYPETYVDIIAYFPDGTTRTDRITILAEELYGSNDNDDYISSYDEEHGNRPYLELPSTAGSYPMQLRVRVSGMELYDGPSLSVIDYSDLFEFSFNAPIFRGFNVGAPIVTNGEWSGHKHRTFKYPFALLYNANTTGRERYTDAIFGLRTDPERTGSYTHWMGVRFYQAK